MPLSAGSRLGRYAIVELLGSGGMGVVYLARDERLQRDVAIKVLPSSVLTDEQARRRFRKEALALAKLNHPNIAAVYDVGEEGDIAYIVMERVTGESLAERLRRGSLSVADTLDVGAQIAEALSDAHEHGVIHRDLKPANVMITAKGQVKVLDFGLAKLLSPPDAANPSLSRTEVGTAAGTPLYMSPEQAFGDDVDARTDVWSLGVVLYESLAGRTPFSGATDWALMRALSEEQPATLRGIRHDVPAGVEALIAQAMHRDLATRSQSAVAVGREARRLLAELSEPRRDVIRDQRRVAPRAVAALAATLLAVVTGGSWFAVRVQHHAWATREALPMATKLIDAHQPLAAFGVVNQARVYAPDDTALKSFAATYSRSTAITSSPAGATVEIQDYLTADSTWVSLGTTPLPAATVPKGYFRWRVTPPHGAPVVSAPLVTGRMQFAFDSAVQPARGMVRVHAQSYADYIAFIGWVGPFALPAFDIDRYEVTNAEYQEFVDAGGYSTPRYWDEPFIDHGTTLSWVTSLARFRDKSGRTGPATWSSGHFPAGEGEFPVAGISWYEAAAYAAYRGNTLPTMAQWHAVAPPEVSRYVATMSNMSRDRIARVGAFRGVGPYGTYDMAGNVREWVLNANDAGARFILGGAFPSPSYLYEESEALPPFDRSPTNGMRAVRNYGSLPAEATRPVRMLTRDFSRFTPASDAVFAAYRVMYSYDATPLQATADGIVQQTPDWRVEKVTFAAAYRQERMSAYLFVPTHVKPPYQTVVFFPSARILFMQDSKSLGDLEYFDYIVQSGRAVLYPVYQDTYERRIKGTMPGASKDLELTTQRAKDVARSLDYLQSRPDIAKDKLAYVGVSMGAAEGVIYTTLVQDRLRTAVFLDGGFFLDQPKAGADPADFAARMKKPVLMVNGRFDATFGYEEAQLPLLRMLGTPAADKQHVVLQTSHDVTTERSALVRSVLGWLDKYLGRVE